MIYYWTISDGVLRLESASSSAHIADYRHQYYYNNLRGIRLSLSLSFFFLISPRGVLTAGLYIYLFTGTRVSIALTVNRSTLKNVAPPPSKPLQYRVDFAHLTSPIFFFFLMYFSQLKKQWVKCLPLTSE